MESAIHMLSYPYWQQHIDYLPKRHEIRTLILSKQRDTKVEHAFMFLKYAMTTLKCIDADLFGIVLKPVDSHVNWTIWYRIS
jgi:hypothetical protein